MSRGSPKPAEIALPLAALAALRRAVAVEAGSTDAAVRVLAQAGEAAGDALFTLLDPGAEAGGAAPEGGAADAEARVRALPAPLFWARLAELFARRGWGHLTHVPLHPGVGALESPDWLESSAGGDEGLGGCRFTESVLARILGRTAGEPVAVREVECRARGDARCRFVFGGHAALARVGQGLAGGRPLDAVLADLR